MAETSLWWNEPKCEGESHLWMWTSSTTGGSNPADDAQCLCGRYTWAKAMFVETPP